MSTLAKSNVQVTKKEEKEEKEEVKKVEKKVKKVVEEEYSDGGEDMIDIFG